MAKIWKPLGYRTPQHSVPVEFYGYQHMAPKSGGGINYDWENTEKVLAVAYDTMIPGYNNNIVNNLRLWKAESDTALDLHSFNQGQYIDAVRDNQLEVKYHTCALSE